MIRSGLNLSFTAVMGQLAVQTCIWPCYEVVDGKYRLTRTPKEKKPVAEWLKPQARFRHLFKPENEPLLETIQKDVDEHWEKLQKLCEAA